MFKNIVRHENKINGWRIVRVYVHVYVQKKALTVKMETNKTAESNLQTLAPLYCI